MAQSSLMAGLTGRELEPLAWSWEPTDTILYALGVGADPDSDLSLVYERCGPAVLSSFASVATAKSFLSTASQLGLPLESVLHGEQSVTVHRPLAAAGSVTVRRVIEEVWDKGNGAVIVIAESDDGEDPLFEARSSWWVAGAGGFDGARGPSRTRTSVPGKPPDFRVEQHVPANLSAIHRLSGDLNPIHIDPEFARSAGYQRPFLHGLATFGLVGLGLTRTACEGDPGRLRRLATRFTAPVYPGDRLVTQGWRPAAETVIVEAEIAGVKVLEGRATLSE